MVEDIVTAAEDNTLERKSQDYTGFKRFLFGSLEALDINVSDYIGQLFPLHPLLRKMYSKGLWICLFATLMLVTIQPPGGLEVRSVQRLARIAQGEDSMSGLYNVIADGIMNVSSFIFNNYLLVD